MKKNFFYVAAMIVGLALTTTACSNDDDNSGDTPAADVDYTAENADSWHNYMRNVAGLLKTDATNLYKYWNESYDGGESYASTFKAHSGGKFTSALNCIEEVLDGCITIANEVGETKIGDPYNKYMGNQVTQALYAVESWYSWHSRDDYTNNIYSIRNAYYGSLNGSVSDKSISKLVAGVNSDLNTEVIAAINGAATAIQAIPQPFRNNINSKETVAAISACSTLEKVLSNKLKPYIRDNKNINDNATLSPIVTNYVDVVVLPTYKDLSEKNAALYDAVVTLANNPSNANFETACTAWITAREPWEKSEAFLFGPVDSKGLDPNMDSWPLDQNGIVQLLKSEKWSDMEWADDDDDAKVEAAQELRGFHTLEFLLFKDGLPRTVK